MLSTASSLQDGIYYSHNDSPRNSFSIVFLRAREEFESADIRHTLSKSVASIRESARGTCLRA